MNEYPSDSDVLVQRFVDQELSGEERMRFIARLGKDEALRRRVLALEKLVLNVSRLPKPTVPENFVSAVLDRTEAEPMEAGFSRPFRQHLRNVIWTPRTFRWNFAGALAAACLVLLIAGNFRPSTPAVVPPQQVLVRFVIAKPGATTVQVAGDFNGWNPARTPLEEISSGAWTVTVPLEPGRYKYMFVVDGQEWIADPFAAEQSDDGFGSRNAVLDVRPPGPATGAPL